MIAPEDLATMQIDEAIHKIDEAIQSGKRPYVHTLDNLDVVKAWVRELEPYVEKIELV